VGRWAIGALARPDRRPRGTVLYRGLSNRDVQNVLQHGAVLPRLPGNRSVTPDQHVLERASGYVSMTRSIDIAIGFANRGPDPSGYVIAIDSARVPGLIDTGRGQGLRDPSARAVAADEQEVLTTMIPASAIVGGALVRQPRRRASGTGRGPCPDPRPGIQCGTEFEVQN
jgi:hypothetical protein